MKRILWTTAWLLCSATAIADDEDPFGSNPDGPSGSQQSPVVSLKEQTLSEPDIVQLIGDLASEQYAQRTQAQRLLTQAGASAVAELEKTVAEGEPEASSRSLEILQRLFERGSSDAKDASSAALQRLSKRTDRIGQFANTLLHPPAQPAQAQYPQGRSPAIRGLDFGGRIRIARAEAVPFVGRRTFSMTQTADSKTIQVEEDGFKLRIVEDAKGIAMEITQPKDGKEATEKFSAKTAEELKEKEPAAFKHYEKYSKQGGGRADAAKLLMQLKAEEVKAKARAVLEAKKAIEGAELTREVEDDPFR